MGAGLARSLSRLSQQSADSGALAAKRGQSLRPARPRGAPPVPFSGTRGPAPQAAVRLAAAVAAAAAAAAAQPSIASSSSIMPEIIDSPLSQNAGSEASSPKGASNSLWCFAPPAFSISKYFSWNPGSPSS